MYALIKPYISDLIAIAGFIFLLFSGFWDVIKSILNLRTQINTGNTVSPGRPEINTPDGNGYKQVTQAAAIKTEDRKDIPTGATPDKTIKVSATGELTGQNAEQAKRIQDILDEVDKILAERGEN